MACTFRLLLLCASAAASTPPPPPPPHRVVSLRPGSSRALPLMGLGNEVVEQNIGDFALAAAAAAAGSRVARFPGGSPSDGFDWKTGCALVEGKATDPFCATYGAATSQRWARYVNHSGRPAVVFDLNVVGTNASYQLEGLRRFEADGVPIELIEFGNELYAWQQNGGKWSDGAGYAKAMRPYLAAMQAAFPKAKTAVVGSGWWPRMDSNWNKAVLANTTATAATSHFYTELYTSGITAATVAARARPLLNQAFVTAKQWQIDAEATIPHHLRIWVTEMGELGPGYIDTPEINETWLQGLYAGLAAMLLLQSPRVDVALPYCLVCGKPCALSAFTTGLPWGPDVPQNESNKVKWSITPRGAVLSELLNAVADARHASSTDSDEQSTVTMQQLHFAAAAAAAAAAGKEALVAATESDCGKLMTGADGPCIHYQKTPTACACQALCANVTGCKAWQWINAPNLTDYSQCFLKSNNGMGAYPFSQGGVCERHGSTGAAAAQCLPPLPTPINRTLIGWAFTRRPSRTQTAVVKRQQREGHDAVMAAVLLHLSPNATTLDLSGLFGQQAAGTASWHAVNAIIHHQPGAALLGNMSTVNREVRTIETLDQARSLLVPPYAVVTLKCH